jgi:hypothetical protein
MKAYQRVMREERAANESDADGLFGAYWEGVDRSIAQAVVREIDARTAATIIDRYEWMGRMPAIVIQCFGIYFDGVLGGAVVFSPEYGENLGIWDRYGYTDRIVLLSRGACAHWAHPHAGSKLVRGAIRLLDPRYEVVTALVDEKAGEVGTIYQACGFVYVGRMRADNPTSSGSWPRREGYLIDGVLYTGRTMRHRFGGQGLDAIFAAHPQVERVTQVSKGRYFAFRGSPAVKRRHREAIAHLIQPYPKRAAGVGETSPASSGEVLGQSQPAAPTQSGRAA